MNIYFIFIQLIGVTAWAFLLTSYHRDTPNKILIFHLVSLSLYCLHYYLLGATSGLITCIFEIIINYAYYKTDKDKYIFISSIPIYIIVCIAGVRSLTDFLPIIASLIDSYTLTRNKKIIVIGATIAHILWVIYDIKVMSCSGIITDSLIAISNINILISEYKIINNKKD